MTRKAGFPLVLALALGCQTATVPETPVATTINITNGPAELSFIGQTLPFGVTIVDQNGQAMTGQTISWTVDDAAVASVTQGGVVGAVANGTATVTATTGSISATAGVTVQQVASAVQITSGLSQEATAGTELAEPIVARAQDAGGAAVAGTSITFAPATDNGTVSVASAAADANGEVSTMWTLGAPFGTQRLNATITGATAQVTAIGRSEFPIADLVVTSPPNINRPDPSTLETFDVSAVIRNEGDLSTTTTFRVQLLADGGEIASVTAGPLAPDNEETVVFSVVGPIAAGSRNISVVADADDDITELLEDNNDDGRTVNVLSQTTVSINDNVAINGSLNDELLFILTVPPGPETTLDVVLTGANGDADLFIESGTRPSAKEDYNTCISAGADSNEACQVVFPEGEYHIVVHAFSAFTSANMSITLGNTIAPFDIDVQILDNGTQSQDDAFLAAAARWSQVIVGDIPDQSFAAQNIAADACATGQPLINDVVDDVRIYVNISAIDGAGGTLAQAGPCATRGLSNLPIVGAMTFDEADLAVLEANGDMNAVILHEMGHVLGIGTIWGPGAKDILRDPSLPSNQGADTHVIGEEAAIQFDVHGGAGFSGSKTPVENMAGQGSGDSHWRESVMTVEFMTPFLNSLTQNPMSSITIGHLADLGYGVDMSQAESYQGITPAPPRAQMPALGAGYIDLSGDIREGPIVVLDRKGNVMRVLR